MNVCVGVEGFVDLRTVSHKFPESALPPAGLSSKLPPGFQLLELTVASPCVVAVRLERTVYRNIV